MPLTPPCPPTATGHVTIGCDCRRRMRPDLLLCAPRELESAGPAVCCPSFISRVRGKNKQPKGVAADYCSGAMVQKNRCRSIATPLPDRNDHVPHTQLDSRARSCGILNCPR